MEEKEIHEIEAELKKEIAELVIKYAEKHIDHDIICSALMVAGIKAEFSRNMALIIRKGEQEKKGESQWPLN